MISAAEIKNHLTNEAVSLQTRLMQMQPFALTMPMVPAASVSADALNSITEMLNESHKQLNQNIGKFKSEIIQADPGSFIPQKWQERYTILKLRFNSILNQLDIFADVLSQRAEHGTGVWVAGLDALAADALKNGRAYYDIPEIIVFLERGHGAAIRRAKTRLPGGDTNPVAVIQVPRERMVGSGIASSLIHEVGHQGAELLGLISPLKQKMNNLCKSEPDFKEVWSLFEKWMSEITADFWSVAHLGICATHGLMGVVSLPYYFQFRIDGDDPHPAPYLRVMLSCAMGNELYPHPQWKQIEDTWEAFYPSSQLDAAKLSLVSKIKSKTRAFARIIAEFKPEVMKGKKLKEIFPAADRQPDRLRSYYSAWEKKPEMMNPASPSLVFAVIGQAKADGRITAKAESELLTKHLNRWAYWRSYYDCGSAKNKQFKNIQ